jgi:membrane-associated protease RseP (regulator of RpoE activity)
MDVTDIEAGVDFVDVLQRAVGSCDVLLAVMGREWLTCTDRNGRRRLDDPHDFIRLEVGIALARNVRVIPVLVEGAVMPTASELPSDLEGLTRRQAVELRDGRWNADVESLAAVLERVLGSKTAGSESAGNRRRHATLWTAAAVAVVAALVAAVMLVRPRGPTPSAPVVQPASGPAAREVQRNTVQAEPPRSSSSEPEVRTNPAPASGQPTRAPTPPAQPPAAATTTPSATPAPVAAPTQPASTAVLPARDVRDDVAPRNPRSPLTPANGFLGVRLSNAGADPSGTGTGGAIVQSIAPGGPAATAGLLVGDLIVEYGGTSVSDAASFNRLVGASAPGDTVTIRVRRGGTGRTLEVVVGDRANAPGSSGSVLVYYAADDDRNTAEDLAVELRKSINDPRYAVRTLKTSRGVGSEGEVHYSSSGFSTLAETLARSAGSWMSRAYGRRVAFRPTVEPRVTSRSAIVIMPARTPAAAGRPADTVVTIAYTPADDPKIAEELATFLRTRSRTEYQVRTVRATASRGKEGQIEYDNGRMAGLAQVLARDAAAWISRTYGREVVLRPTLSGRIGGDAVLLWLPSR